MNQEKGTRAREFFKENYEPGRLLTPADWVYEFAEHYANELLKLRLGEEKRFDIDFGGKVLAGISVKNNTPEVFGAIDGFGDGIDGIKIKERDQ